MLTKWGDEWRPSCIWEMKIIQKMMSDWVVYQVFGLGISFGQSSLARDYTIHMCVSNFILSCGMIGQSCDICVETGSVMIERSQNPTQWDVTHQFLYELPPSDKPICYGLLWPEIFYVYMTWNALTLAWRLSRINPHWIPLKKDAMYSKSYVRWLFNCISSFPLFDCFGFHLNMTPIFPTKLFEKIILVWIEL